MGLPGVRQHDGCRLALILRLAGGDKDQSHDGGQKKEAASVAYG
jgi:hypothetical protein